MKNSLALLGLFVVAFLFLAPAALADAVCVAGPSCPGFSPTPLGPISAVEGVQGVLPGGALVTAGDVLLQEPGPPPITCTPSAPGSCSDILRFFDIGNGMATSFLLFSDDPGTEPSDFGIPVTVQANNFTLLEVGGVLYTAGNASYLILSDTASGADTPEPGGVALMGAGIAALLLLKVRKPGDRHHRPRGPKPGPWDGCVSPH
jgi:hypothetical protein